MLMRNWAFLQKKNTISELMPVDSGYETIQCNYCRFFIEYTHIK